MNISQKLYEFFTFEQTVSRQWSISFWFSIPQYSLTVNSQANHLAQENKHTGETALLSDMSTAQILSEVNIIVLSGYGGVCGQTIWIVWTQRPEKRRSTPLTQPLWQWIHLEWESSLSRKLASIGCALLLQPEWGRATWENRLGSFALDSLLGQVATANSDLSAILVVVGAINWMDSHWTGSHNHCDPCSVNIQTDPKPHQTNAIIVLELSHSPSLNSPSTSWCQPVSIE